MKIPVLPLVVSSLCTVICLTACNKASAPAAPANAPATSSRMSGDSVQQKLQEYSGTGATDCGRLDMQAAPSLLKIASDCVMHASQQKHAFHVAYDMPGMTIGVAGNSDGKLFSVQAQGAAPSPTLTSGDCPSQLRVASSGRISCFAPGDMSSMGAGHAAGALPSGGMTNPHTAPAPSRPPNHP
jgi:hypothetical protein